MDKAAKVVDAVSEAVLAVGNDKAVSCFTSYILFRLRINFSMRF